MIVLPHRLRAEDYAGARRALAALRHSLRGDRDAVDLVRGTVSGGDAMTALTLALAVLADELDSTLDDAAEDCIAIALLAEEQR